MRSEKKMKRPLRIALSAFLLAAMLLSTLLFSGCAATSVTVPDVPDVSGAACGDGVVYDASSALKRLTIRGTGAMADYASSKDVPWAEYASGITEIVIEDGVTAIGDYAFYYCINAAEVKIESTVLTSIGDYAFWMCSKLPSVKIPNSVTSIGDNAFAYCAALTSFEAKALNTLGASAFAGCSVLDDVTLDGTLTEIKADTFLNCPKLTEKSVSCPDTVTTLPEEYKTLVSYIKSVATLKIVCKDDSGNLLEGYGDTKTLNKGDAIDAAWFDIAVEGYTYVSGKDASFTVMPGEDVEVTLVYKANVAETEPSDTANGTETGEPTGTEQPKNEEESTPIIFLVVFVIILIALIVGAVLLMRSGNSPESNSQTVRKNDPSKKSSKKK